jgi:DNA-directed RNA polymerase I and III subunit RPAC2
MPSVTEEKVAPKIIDPASEHGDEIDASVDRDRIRVVRKEEFSQERLKANVAQLAGATESAASFQFDGEDHTLGNALRYIIMKK